MSSSAEYYGLKLQLFEDQWLGESNEQLLQANFFVYYKIFYRVLCS